MVLAHRNPLDASNHEPQVGRLQKLFRSSPFAALRRLSLDLVGEVLTLRGRVPNYYTKQMALAVARRLDGVAMVIDELEVSVPQAS